MTSQGNQLHGAIQKRFGKDDGDNVVEINPKDLKEVETAGEFITDDHATVTQRGEQKPQFYLKKINGKWKVDLSRDPELKDLDAQIKQLTFLIKGIRHITADVERGILSSTGKEMKTRDDLLNDVHANTEKAAREIDNKKSGEEKKT